MKVEQRFTVARPIGDVWAFFHDIPAVASCLPGAEMTGEKSPGVYTGKVSLKLGPFGASFEGEAAVAFDEAARTGHVEGKGVDKRGGSRSKMVVDFALTEPAPGNTEVAVDADVTLSGAIAQFGRTGIIQETANILVGEFVRNLEAKLAPAEAAPPPAAPAPAQGVSVMRLGWMVLKSWVARLFGR
ncbi:carbon monoxide dehydrogenase [Rhodovarius crocodyli]|uniref:Carbon monoxide dehydrogenase n=1 Tax=Rhodovarius crocodyli TaxID=1979269 RepID=A0A437M417_9PROT|nr:SRPBCC family protein [Rhodovarius crocodyli]RVT92315.1 carbon monoxide dehydrogenase [Rhodovarius crocodyli]